MKFFQLIVTLVAYCIGLALGVSYVIRIGGPRTPPILPGQVWKLPGVGDVIVVRAGRSYVYYEAIDDRDQTWSCRTRTFREHAELVVGRVLPAPIFHLVDPDSSNIIQLKKDKKDDPA